MRTIFIEGASTAFGMHDYERGGWAARLHLDLMAANAANILDPTIVVNRAVPGMTLPAIARNVVPEMVRFRRIGPVTTILSVGMNEAKILPGETKPLISLLQFQLELGKYATHARGLDIPTVYVGPQPIDIQRTVPTSSGSILEDDLLEEYASVMRETAQETDMPFVDTRALLSGHDLSEVLDRDGYHPNSLGHAILHDAVKAALTQLHVLPPVI